MADYKLGVDSSSNSYKLYKSDATGENLIATISGLKDNLINNGDSLELSSNTCITVTKSSGNYTVTVGKDALQVGEDTMTVSFKPAVDTTVILALGSDVEKGNVNYNATVSNESEKGVIIITPSATKGWYIEGTSIKYDSGNSQSTTATKISGDLKANISDNDFTLDKNTKTITLKTSAFDMANLANDATVEADNTAFNLKLDTAFITATNTQVADTEFTWDITADKVTVNGTEIDSKKAVLQKKVTPGWKTTKENQKYTYSKPGDLTYVTITGLAATATTMPSVEKTAKVTESVAYSISLDAAVLPTVEGAVVTLQNGGTVNVDGTEKTPKFQLATNAPQTATALDEEYETKVEVKTGNSTATATVSQMMSEYWEVDETNKNKITYHASKASTTPLATVTGLAATAKGGDNLASGETANVFFNTTSIRSITLGKDALPATGAVTLKSTDYSIEFVGDVTEYDQEVHGEPVVDVSGTTATIKVTPNPGWELGTKNAENQTATYNAPAAVTVATIKNVANGVNESNITISGNTITLNKAVLPDNANANTTVTLAENTDAENIYQSEYDFKLVLDSSTENGVTQYGSAAKTPVLFVEDTNKNVNSEETGDRTAKIQVVNSAGWELDSNGLTVTKKAQETVDWVKLTGLGSDAVYDANAADPTTNTVTFDATTKTIKVKESALADGDAKIVPVDTTNGAGYTIAFDGDVTEPGSTYDKNEVLTLSEVDNNGTATIKGKLVKGWTLNDDANIITFKDKTEEKTLATISGLKSEATQEDVALGTDTTDTNVVYLKKDALGNNEVKLTYADLKTTVGDKEISFEGDFKLGLKKAVDNNEVVSNTLGFDPTHAWVLNTAQTKATYKEGTTEGWTLATDGLKVTHTAAVADANGTTLLTVNGLKGGSDFKVQAINDPEDGEISAVGLGEGNDFVPLLYISKAYTPGQAAVAADPENGVEAKEAVAEAAGNVMIKRSILDDSATGKAATLSVNDESFGKYEFALYSGTTSGDATTYVPSKGITKYIWKVETSAAGAETTSATYREATAAYWKLSDDKKTATYNAQTNGTTLARITGIAKGLSAVEGDDFTAHSKTRTEGDPYVITGSFIYNTTVSDNNDPPDENNAVISVTQEYMEDSDTDTDGKQEQLGIITLTEGALANADVTFTTNDGQHYRLALDSGVDALEYKEPSWEVDDTTATYLQEVENTGYALDDTVESGSDTVGSSIIYNENTPKTLAIITGLKNGIKVDSSDETNIGMDVGDTFETGIAVNTGTDATTQKEYYIFTINGNVLDTAKVELTDVASEGSKLAVGEGAIDGNTTEEELKARIETGVDVWRTTKDSNAGTTAYYRKVKLANYTVGDNDTSITYHAESNIGTPYVTISGLSTDVIINESAPDGSTFESKIGYTDTTDDSFVEGFELVPPAEETDPTTIKVKNVAMLDKNKVASIPSSAKYVFELDYAEDITDETGSGIGRVAVNDASWEVSSGTAVLKGTLTEGWGTDTTNKTITHYGGASDRIIATIRGLSSTTEANDLNGVVELPDEVDGSFELSSALFDKKDVTLENGTNLDGNKFTYGIKLDTPNTTAVAGEARWYLADDTTLNYSTIHDAHYEDNADTANRMPAHADDVNSTTIKYYGEIIDETPIISITNLANGTAFTANFNDEGVTPNKYYKDTSKTDAEGTPVTGISVTGKIIMLSDTALVFEDPTKPLTLTTTDSYKFNAPTATFNIPASGSETFDVSGTTAKLYSGKSAGYSATGTTVAYVKPTLDKVITEITGLKSGLVVGTDVSNNQSAVGTKNEQDTFTSAITYDKSTYAYTVKKDALTNTDVKIASGKGTLTLDDANTNKPEEHYVWKVSGAEATYNKGTTEGWTQDGTKAIKHHEAAYETVVSKVTGLVSGLKVNPENDQQVFDKNGDLAIDLYDTSKVIQLHLPALTTKDVLLKRTMDTENPANPISEKAASLKLFQEKETVSGVEKEKDGYVKNKVVAGKFDAEKVSGNKATYTVTTTAGYDVLNTAGLSDDDKKAALTFNKVEYDDRIIYTKAGKVTSTITGLKNETNTVAITLADVDGDATTGQFTVPKDSIAPESGIKLTNGNGNSFTLKLGAGANVDKGSTPVWNFKNGTATYTATYTKGDYVTKTAGLEYTYLKDDSTETIFTITGLDKEKYKEGTGLANDNAFANTYGIKAVADKLVTEATQDTPAVTKNVVELTHGKVKFANANVVLKKGTQEYEFDMGDLTKTTEAEKQTVTGKFAVQSYADEPRWGYNKGTATLDAGTSAGWEYKSETDHTTLTYKAAKANIVATIKGLNATNLELNKDGKIVSFTETTNATTGETTKAYSSNPVIDYTNATEEGEPDTITLKASALVTGNALKDKVKVTLSGSGNYVLVTDESIILPERQSNVWSIDTKGVASYQYNTTAGWKLDNTKTLSYSASKDTVLAKISGLTKDTNPDTSGLGISTYELDTTKSTDTKKVYKAGTKDTVDFIEVIEGTTDDGDHKKYTFKFKATETEDTNSTKGKVYTNKALTTGNVTLTAVDKTSGNKYEIVADENLANQTHNAKWTVDGKSGKATYTTGTYASYTNGTGNKAGTLITYVKPSTSKNLATITGLLKDAEQLTEAKFNAAVEVENNKINITNAQNIFSSGDKATTVTLTSKEGYTFGEVKGTNVKDPTPALELKSGTVNVVKTAAAGDFTVSTDNMKVVYNKKATPTILATVKGLNKTLTDDNLKILTGSATVGDADDYVILKDGTITLSKDALANSKVTFTLGKGVAANDYKLALDSTQVKNGEIMTNTGNWSQVTGWVINKGTATYKTYDQAYYIADGKGGYNYIKEKKGTIHATITGLNPELTTLDSSVFKSAGTITLTKEHLVTTNAKGDKAGKNVTLKNQSGYDFKLALSISDANYKSELDTTNSLAWDKGKLTVTKKAGYEKVSDTSITYLAKAKEKQLVATLSGINKNATFDKPTSLKDVTITIDKADVDKKNITLTTTSLAEGDYKLQLATGTSALPTSTVTAEGSTGWSLKSGTATYTGYVTEGYKLAESGKSISYTKALGYNSDGTTKDKPKALTTIKGVTATPTGDATSTVTGNNVTLSSGLFAVTYDGTGSITGSKDNDSITANKPGVTVTPGKGDDFVTLSKTNGVDTIIYANNDGHDVIANFASKDKIKINGVNITKDNITTSGTGDNAKTIITVGKGSIELRGYDYTTEGLSITDKSGTEKTYGSAADLLIDNNYSMDAAALSDIVEPFHASYTPYDFEAGLDLVKQNAFAPALTYMGTSDKK